MNVNILYTFGRTPKENYNLKDKVVWLKCACVCSAQQVLLYMWGWQKISCMTCTDLDDLEQKKLKRGHKRVS